MIENDLPTFRKNYVKEYLPILETNLCFLKEIFSKKFYFKLKNSDF